MKRILSFTLALIMVFSVVCTMGFTVMAEDGAEMFWLTHYNDSSREGAGVVFTETYTGAGWWLHFAFAPIEGAKDAYEITATVNGLSDGSAKPLAVPEGGFVYAINTGNNYPGGINYTSANCNGAIARAKDWKVGDKFTFTGLDLEGKTIPTSTSGKDWYDPDYVCTATVAPYVPAVLTNDIQKQGLNIARGAAEDKPARSDQYNTSLTDGRVATGCNYGADQWWGPGLNNDPNKVGTVSAVIDLGTAKAGYATRVHIMHGSAGIGVFESIGISISSDGQAYNKLGAIELASNRPASSGEWVDFDFSGWETFRYIKYDFKYRNNFSFVDEVEVFGLADLPEGATKIDNAGYFHGENKVQILAGDGMTVSEITALGVDDKGVRLTGGKDLNYNYTYIVNQYGIVEGVYETLGRPEGAKSDLVCPVGGYILAVHGNLTKPTINVGDQITLYNINPALISGKEGCLELVNAGFTAVAHTHTFDEGEVTTEPTLAKAGVKTFTCTECGTPKTEATCPVIAENAKLVNGTTGTFQNGKGDPSYAYGYGITYDADNMYIHIVTNRKPTACDSTVEAFDTYITTGTHLRVWIDGTPDDTSRTGLLDIAYDGEKLNCYDTKVASTNFSASIKAFDDHADILITVPLETYKLSGSFKMALSMSENFGTYDAVVLEYLHNYIYNGNPEAPWTTTAGFETLTIAPTLPEGAIKIDRAGYEHANGHVQILAGNGETTIGALTALGCGAEKDLNYHYTYIINEHGSVVKALELLGREPAAGPNGIKTNEVVPAGCYVLAVGGSSGEYVCPLNPDNIKEGDIITLYNVDLEALRGAKDWQALTNAGFSVTPHTHDFKNPVTNLPKMNEEGSVITVCDCGTQHIETSPIVKVQPEQLETVPDGVIKLKYAGLYFDTASAVVLTGYSDKEVSLSELGVLAEDEAYGLAYWAAIICNAKGEVISVLPSSSSPIGSNKIPAGGFAVAIHCDNADASKLTAIKVGQIVTVHNVLLEKMRGVGGTARLTDAFITYADAPTAFEIEVNVNEKAILTDGTKDVSGNWGSGAGTDNVLLIKNEQCKELPMNVTVKYDLGETKSIESVSMFLYHCAGVMIGYPEGKAKVSVSTDGTTYTSVGEFDFAAAELASGKFGTVENKFAFDAVDARYIKVEFAAGSNEAVLGATPADNKIFWEFVSMTEFEVGEAEVPAEVEVNVNEKAILTDGTKDVNANWNSGASGDNVLLIANTECTKVPMNVTVKYDLGETKSIESVSMYLYHCANVMIGYPEGKAKISVSTDGTTYTSVGEFDFAAAELATDKFGTVENKFAFDAVDARYIKVEFAAGSNEAILGKTPAGGKIYWEFVSMTEFEVGEVEAEPIAKGDIDGDGAVDAFDYQMLKAYVLGSYTEATADQIARMDLNGDGSVDAFDYQMLKCVVLGTYQFD